MIHHWIAMHRWYDWLMLIVGVSLLLVSYRPWQRFTRKSEAPVRDDFGPKYDFDPDVRDCLMHSAALSSVASQLHVEISGSWLVITPAGDDPVTIDLSPRADSGGQA